MFENITQDMIDQLDGINRSQFERLREIVDSPQSLSGEFIYNLGELANSMALKSHTTGMEYKIAAPLYEALEKLLDSQRAGASYNITYQQEISDAKIDLCYASGNRQFASSRLATFFMSMQYYDQNALQTPLAPGISRFA